MAGNFIDSIRLSYRSRVMELPNTNLIDTDYGRLRVLDTKGNKAVIVCVPDGPNVIEHHLKLIGKLSVNFRVVCFEFPGFGFSYPSRAHDYSLERSARIVINLLDILRIERAALAFSCGNGFYAIKAAQLSPERFTHLFLTQTPSLHSMKNWAGKTIPKMLTYPVVGQLANALIEKKLAKMWYEAALPREKDKTPYQAEALNALNKGGCFCLSGMVQGLMKEVNTSLQVTGIPSTQIWGSRDFTHRKTDNKSINEHLPSCEIVEFESCGHFPELEATDNYVRLVNERLIARN